MHIPTEAIDSMTLSGSFNDWHIDELIVGGEPGYLGLRRDYGYAAERLKTLIGAPWLEFGTGRYIIMDRFYTADQIKNDDLLYWNPETKEILYAPGISDDGALVWAFNEHEDIINWGNIFDQAKHDFSEKIAYEDIQPGDVFFIDYAPADGMPDECGIVIEPQYDQETGMYEDIIRIIPEAGVHYGSSEFINSLYDTVDGFVDYRALPDSPKGGHSPYPKVPTKHII